MTMETLRIWQGIVYLSAVVSAAGSVVYLLVYVRSLLRRDE